MSLLLAITVGVAFAISMYLLTGRELKGIAMGVFLLGHGANLAIIAVSRSPVGRTPPILGPHGLIRGTEADPLPQALILTAIVIGFAVQAFLLSLLVLTWRRTRSLQIDTLRDAVQDEYDQTSHERSLVECTPIHPDQREDLA
ncbi:MAG TPA: sodium:proton antiporter [Tepidisphaeraceae bacterium]|nr:sodium:proton antiporter [Tepidisphaeraceae bacterium]